MEEKLRKLNQRSQILTSHINDQNSTPIQRAPMFIQSLAQSSKFGEEAPQPNLRDNAHLFWMEKGVDTAGLQKSLNEGKSSLVFSNTPTISDYDVEGYIRQYHENAIASTLEESQSIFDDNCSSRIWKMMNKEFMETRSIIINSENKQTNLHSSTATANNLPLSSRKLVTPPVISTYSPEDDVSKIVIYEPVLQDLFDSLISHKTPEVAAKMLETLQNSHQDIAGEIFCWRLVIHQLNLRGVPLRHYRKSLQFLQEEYKEYMRRVIVRARSIADLPEGNVMSVCEAYVGVMTQGKETHSLDMASSCGLSLWMILVSLLHSGCRESDVRVYEDDVLRYAGAVGPDVVSMIIIIVKLLNHESIDVLPHDILAMIQRIRGLAHRLSGAGTADSYKLFLLSLLSSENPYSLSSVTVSSGDVVIPQQEVLITLQDWIWHKLVSIYINYHIPHDLSSDRSDFLLSSLRTRIIDCGPSHFDPNHTSPFSYLQTLFVIGEYSQAITYLLQQHHLLQAIMLGFLLNAYGIVNGAESVYVVALLRLIPHLPEKPKILTHLVSFVKEHSVKTDLLVLVLLHATSQTTELVGNLDNNFIRNKGYFDKVEEIQVDEIVKNSAVQLNIRNEWKRAVSLFKLCNNWDHAADIYLTKLGHRESLNDSEWHELVISVREFVRESMKERVSLSSVNQHSLSMSLQMIDLLIICSSDQLDDCIRAITSISFLPFSNQHHHVIAAVNACRGLKPAVIHLLPQVILAVCGCIAKQFSLVKQALYVTVSEEERVQMRSQLEQLRQQIEAYEQFVGITGIPIPPAINEQLSRIVINMV